MRVSTGYQYDTYRTNVRDAQSLYFQIQQQLATGKKFERSGDDPLNATLSLDSRRMKVRLEQFQQNLRGAKDYLGNTETALSEVSTVMRQAYTVAIQGASDSLSQTSRTALANQVDELQKRLVQLGNTTGSSGQYIFSGHLTKIKPFTESSGSLVYNGDNGIVQTEVRPSDTIRVNLAGADVMFSDMYDSLTQLKNDLLSGNVIQISQNSIDALNGWVTQVNQVRGETGNKLQTLESLSNENQRRIDELTGGISEIEDIDFAEVFVKYQGAQTAYQAALQVTSQGMGMSLLDFIR